MGDYDETTTVRMAPAELFAYLRDIENLPRYLPYLESARPLDGDLVEVIAKGDPDGEAGPDGTVKSEAWMRVVEEAQRLEWGSPGPNDYSGSLDVSMPATDPTNPGSPFGYTPSEVRVTTSAPA